MTKIKVNSDLATSSDKNPSRMTAILNNRYSSVSELSDAFIVSGESSPILITWDSPRNTWVGQPFEFIDKVHPIGDDGSY